MVAPLPAELIALTLDRANEGEAPPQRQANRNNFRLVNKAWHGGVDRWKEVFLEGRQVQTVLSVLTASPGLCSAIQRLHLCTQLSQGHSPSQGTIISLLELCTNLTALSLFIGVTGQVKNLSPAFATALGALARMKHFALISYPSLPNKREIRFTILQAFVPRWSQLESFAIVGHRIFMPTTPRAVSRDLFINNTILKSLTLEPWHHNIRDMHNLLVGVPASLTSLTLDLDFFDQRDIWAQEFAQQLGAVAPPLEELVLRCKEVPRGEGSYEIPRGWRLDAAVANLTAVRRLTLPSFAVGSWAEAFEPLKELEALTVEEVDDRYVPGIACDELSAVVRGAGKLAKVRAASRVWEAWTEEERAAFEEIVRKRNVVLEVV